MSETNDHVPFWRLFRRESRTGYASERLLSVYRDYGVVPRESREDNNNRLGTDINKYQLVEPGDLAVNKMKAWQGSLGVSDHRGIVSPAYFVYRPLHSSSSRYLNYVLRSRPLVNLYAANSKGIRPAQWDLQPERLDQIRIPAPLLPTQRAIADYLDRETTEIDGMRADLDEIERLLRERRTAFIGSTVRQGSSHGKKVSLQSVASIHAGDTITSSEITEHGEYRVYGGNGVRGYCDRSNHLEDKVLVGRQGALCGNVHLARGPFYASEHALVVEPRIKVSLDWLTFVLQDQKLGQLSMSAAQPGITASAVGLQRIHIPPLPEQRRIADEINHETAEVDSMLSDITKLRDLLAERRAALISAAVTGQIDIPVSPTHKDEAHA